MHNYNLRATDSHVFILEENSTLTIIGNLSRENVHLSIDQKNKTLTISSYASFVDKIPSLFFFLTPALLWIAETTREARATIQIKGFEFLKEIRLKTRGDADTVDTLSAVHFVKLAGQQRYPLLWRFDKYVESAPYALAASWEKKSSDQNKEPLLASANSFIDGENIMSNSLASFSPGLSQDVSAGQFVEFAVRPPRQQDLSKDS